MVGGKGDLCEVRHKNQQEHRKGGDNELTSHN